MTHIFYYVLSILLFLSFIDGTVFIDVNDTSTMAIVSTNIRYFNSKKLDFVVDPYNITGFITPYKESIKNYSGLIVLIKYHYGSDIIARDLKSYGAIGMIMGSEKYVEIGKADYQLVYPRDAIEFPSVQVSFEDYCKIYDIVTTEQASVITFDSEEIYPNKWDVAYNSVILLVYRIYISVLYVSIFILSIITLVYTIRIYGWIFNFRIGIITLEIILCVMCTVFAIDPFNRTRLMSCLVLRVFFYNLGPINMVATVVVSLHWLEILIEKRMAKCDIISLIKILFYILLFILFVIVLIFTLIILLIPIAAYNIIIWILTFVVVAWFLVATFQIVVGQFILARLSKMGKAFLVNKDKLGGFTVKVIAIAFIDYVALILYIILLVLPANANPEIVISYSLISFTVRAVRSIVNLSLIFQKKKDVEPDPSGSSSNSKKTPSSDE